MMGEPMQFHIAGRQQGKTSAMLRWMQEAPVGEHRVVACISHVEAMRLLRLSGELGLNLESWQFVSGEEISGGGPGLWSGVLRGRGGEIVIGIDNADHFLQRMFVGWRVDRVAATGELWVPDSLPDQH